ncbi:uncharacterized protein LOC115452138 [Manduca sexta]|uniref:Uncharacterized protein n=1 Tax=Manduca sexta TaxID=7130 RepID=A0A922CYI2_MANSE|nr:uncharacterized protein LOC115452138 [Manduca sexta]XP_030036459.1 uncharacterized protein LOC115452138 [Manduca sexta]KAG6463087.1 hypothetical protein O3G_MSEX013662 [Manduca sexta]
MTSSRPYVTGHKPDGRVVDPSITEAQTRSDETIDLISRYDHLYDKLIIKRKYFKKLRKIYKLYGDKIFHNTCNEMILHENIDFIKKSTPMFNSQHLSVDVIQKNGEDILIVKRDNPRAPVVKLLSAEECFSVILKAHKESNHGNAEVIRNLTEHQYRYPQFCIPLVLQSCNVCKEVSKSYNVMVCKEIETDKSIWKLAIHRMETNKIGKYLYFFVYVEVVTTYIIIRPLTKLVVEELGMELMKIFTTFGPPKKILTARDYEHLVKRTLNMMGAMDERYTALVERCQDYIFDIASVLVAMKKWFKQSGSNDWVTACSLVQWQLNTSVRLISRNDGQQVKAGIPYNLFFGSKANTFNHISDDVVAEQLSPKSHNPIILEIGSGKTSKVTDQILDLSSDESGDESSACGVCKEEFALYNCLTCDKPVHYKCGRKIPQDISTPVKDTARIVCKSC